MRASSHRAVREGLVVDVGQSVQQAEVIGVDALDAVACAIAVGNLLRVGRLIERRIAERDRARVDRIGGTACHHRDDRAGVDAARQERTQRHLGNHPDADGIAQALDQLVLCGEWRKRRARLERQIPVFVWLGEAASAAHGERAGWRELERLAEDGIRLGHVAVGEVILDRPRFDFPLESRMR